MKFPRMYLIVVFLFAGFLFTEVLTAQQEPPSAEAIAIVKAMTPGSQHAFLAEQVGTWKATLLVWTDPSEPPIEGSGILERQMILGGRVLREVLEAKIMELPFEGVGHIGFDNVTGEFWSTWFDNMTTGVISLKGMIETSGKGTLIGEVSEAMIGKRVPMRLQIYTEESKQITEAYMPLPGKGMVLTMKTIYERQ